MSTHTFDVLIAGGGIVGLATAWQLQQRQPQLRIAVLEKEMQVASHQSSRNSGVIHSGIYYRPESLRARNCRRGYQLMLEFCQNYGVPHEICGKLIVANTEAERAQLDGIMERGRANGLSGIRRISGAEAREREPHVQAAEAILVPEAGITDYGLVARRYAELFEQNGGTIFLGQKVQRIIREGSTSIVETNAAVFRTRTFVNCCGLYSDKVAQSRDAINRVSTLQILPFRGEYYDLIPERAHLVQHLIYPTPNPNFPFLGVHFTRMIHGGIEAGPNAVLAFRREGYGKTDIYLPELWETLRFPGFRKLARKHWREGWAEMQRSFFKSHFVKALQRLVPEITEADVRPARAGVRAMACLPDGTLSDDFVIYEMPGIINVCNAPSPAATASLAIGETIAARIAQ
ncbi:MAG: L-2-hydroxyglutarate oxidase [Chitinophagales bacterium]|nr:L-2-hydroxyglutarate oxidase [Chitinophagales bacterium]